MATAMRKRGPGVGKLGGGLVQAGLAVTAAMAVEAWLKKTSGRKVADALRAALPSAAARIEMPDPARSQRVILLPGGRGLRSKTAGTANFLAGMLSQGPAAAVRAVGGPSVKMKVVDSIHEDGAKLVETTAEDLQKLRAAQPGLIVVPERFFDLAVNVYRVEQSARPAAGAVGASRILTVEVVSRADGKAVSGATVVAFIDFTARVGAEGVTSSKGTVSLKLPASAKKLERVYVYPESMLWGALRKNVAVASGVLKIPLASIDLGADDSLRHFAGVGTMQDGQGVKVGVVDTGIALGHPDLHVSGGECTVPGESPTAFGPLGGDHGSHCAGIIAARGSAPIGVRGVAPAASLFSFRVFPTPSNADRHPGASNFAIAKAIDRAVAAGCDLLNLSLGGGGADSATEAAIEDAYNAGVVVIAATGNDDRQPVSFPASFDLCVAVSAIGRKGLFPAGTVFGGDVAAPFGKDKRNFVAAFSNVGDDVDCTGPGVAVVSTVPDATYAAMSGTSMATPAVTGLAARRLAKNQALLKAPRDQQRAAAIIKEVLSSAKDLGFQPTFQGRGLPT
jgi:subtilisin